MVVVTRDVLRLTETEAVLRSCTHAYASVAHCSVSASIPVDVSPLSAYFWKSFPKSALEYLKKGGEAPIASSGTRLDHE